MSSFKKLNKADITTVPYAANKQWNFVYDLTSISSTTDLNTNKYFKVYSGANIPGPFVPATDPLFNNQYRRLMYDMINHMFYQAYNNETLNTGSLMFNVSTYQSASQQRPTASYFDYNINPLLIKNFPTGSGDEIIVLSIDQNTYGSKVLPHSFKLSGDNNVVNIIDDGNGNLLDIAGAEDGYVLSDWVDVDYFEYLGGLGIKHIGNIFYAHGLAIITAQEYQTLFDNSIVSYVLLDGLGISVILTEDLIGMILQDPQAYIKYADAVGLTQGAAIPA